jgi:hypothetical protein
MHRLIEYGINCPIRKEKELVRKINTFLTKECNYRKMYILEDVTSIFTYIKSRFFCKTYLWDMGGTEPEFAFHLCRNRHEEITTDWNMFFYNRDNNKENNEFLEKLLEATGFPKIIIYEKMEENSGTESVK